MPCDMCRLQERLAEVTKERDYYKRQAEQWASVVQRQGLSYAEEIQLDEFEAQLPP